MQRELPEYPQTIVIRHKKENRKKCTLRGLDLRPDFRFFTYPGNSWPTVTNYVLLSLDGPVLSQADLESGILLLDGTWRYAERMMNNLEFLNQMERRALPQEYRTAYPRRQEDCPNPKQGLASIEALYAAHTLLKRSTKGLLDNYHWKEEFLSKNKDLLDLSLSGGM